MLNPKDIETCYDQTIARARRRLYQDRVLDALSAASIAYGLATTLQDNDRRMESLELIQNLKVLLKG